MPQLEGLVQIGLSLRYATKRRISQPPAVVETGIVLIEADSGIKVLDGLAVVAYVVVNLPAFDIAVMKGRSVIDGSSKVLKRSVVVAYIEVRISSTCIGQGIRTNCDCFVIVLNRSVILSDRKVGSSSISVAPPEV